MLTLFTNITEQLTDLEKNQLVPMLLETLRYTSKRNTLRGKDISSWFRASGQDVSEVRIRKMVNYIRVTNAAKPNVLIGSSNGYFLTSDVHTVDEQIKSLEGRIDSMKAAIDSIKSQRLNLVHQ
jgi:hypothetical protein